MTRDGVSGKYAPCDDRGVALTSVEALAPTPLVAVTV